jgi:hypothetical protein
MCMHIQPETCLYTCLIVVTVQLGLFLFCSGVTEFLIGSSKLLNIKRQLTAILYRTHIAHYIGQSLRRVPAGMVLNRQMQHNQ